MGRTGASVSGGAGEDIAVALDVEPGYGRCGVLACMTIVGNWEGIKEGVAVTLLVYTSELM